MQPFFIVCHFQLCHALCNNQFPPFTALSGTQYLRLIYPPGVPGVQFISAANGLVRLVMLDLTVWRRANAA